jgi:acyl carrier protein
VAERHPHNAVEGAPAPVPPASTTGQRAQAFLLRFLSRELHLTPDQVQPHRDLRDYGADSITAMRLIRAVADNFHVHMTGRDLLEHHTMHALLTYLTTRIDASQAVVRVDAAPMQPTAPDALEQFRQGILTIEDIETRLAQGEIV